MEPFSTAAAAISLAPIALQVGLKLFNTISRLKGISAELRRLESDLEECMQIVSEIQSFCNTHEESGHLGGMHLLFETIQSRLKSFVQDVEKLQLVIGKPSDNNEVRRNRFGKGLKSIFNERKIMELSSRLATHKASLQLGLTTALGYDGQAMKNSLLHMAKGINCLHEGQTTLKNEVTESSARSDSNFSIIKTGINTLESLIRTMDQPWLSVPGESIKTTIVLYGSTTDGAASLVMLCPQIRHLLLPSTLSFDTTFPRGVAKWFLSQLNALLSDLEEDESQELMPWPPDLCGSRNLAAGGRDSAAQERIREIPLTRTSRRVRRESLPHHTCPKSLTRTSPIETVVVEEVVSSGTICMIFKREIVTVEAWSRTDQKIFGRTVFIPKHDCSLAGITVEFARRFRGGNEVPRTLSTFGIHLDASPVFKHLKAGDTNMIRKMLSKGLISPNDRDQRGNTLLWYAISDFYNDQMCRVLIEEGAEVSDCNKYGDHALAILLCKLPANPSCHTKVGEDALSLVRLLIRRCRGEASSMCSYKKRSTTVRAGAGPFHCLLSPFNCNIGTLELLKLILENGFDLESRDVNGNTPLLYSMYYTPEFQLIEVVSTLLRAEADILVLNKHGEGCLHLLLRRLSACNNYTMSHELASSVIEILVILLEQGCDPTLGNIVGYTPLDAALSPTALPLLFSALERVGTNIMNMILAIDERSGIALFEAEIEEKFAEVSRGVNSTEPISPGTEYNGLIIHGPCYLCGCWTNEIERQMPFDEFTSKVVEELGFGIHMMLCNHYYGEECLRVQEDDSCHFLDYLPDTMSYKRRRKRSLNRHVAYRMWRDGILRSPGDCQRWAVGFEGL